MLKLQEGLELVGELKEINRLQLVKYAGASGDFNPLHFDEEYAKSKGQSTITMHGMLGAGILGELVGKIAGIDGFINKFEVRFVKEVSINSKIFAKAKVRKVVTSQKGKHIYLDMWLENASADVFIKGEACILF